jgi:hemin uptake protein HemP
MALSSPPPSTPRPVLPNDNPSLLAASRQAEFDSRELMRGGREVLIRHAGQTYRLRHTRNDKLILVK